MTEPTPSVEEQAPSSAVQPGDLRAKLVECREQAGLDVDQAAEELHLSKHILQSLENEDFAKLPEPPYVRGYLRGYAKLADHDARELIQVYEALRGAEPDDIAHHFAPARPLSSVAQPTISPSTMKFIGFGALVLLLGLFSMIPGVREWATHTWSSFSAQTNPPEVPDSLARPPSAMEAFAAQKAAREKEAEERKAAEQRAETGPEPTAATPEAGNQLAAAGDAATMPAATSRSVGQAINPAASTAEDGQAAPTEQNTQVVTAEPVATPAGDSPATDTTAATGTEPAAAAPEQPQPIAGEVSVKLEFTEEVWMQVKDSNDRKTLFESLNSPGSIKEFKASTPLDFKVGNASGVKIYLNGQLYDQTPYTKGSVARFKVE